MNRNPFAWSFRVQFLFGMLACMALLAYAIFEQFHMGIEPCPKCIFQRIAFIVMATFFLLGAVHDPRAVGRRVYAVLVAIAAVVGAVADALGARPAFLVSVAAGLLVAATALIVHARLAASYAAAVA